MAEVFEIDERPRKPGRRKKSDVSSPLVRLTVGVPLDLFNLMEGEEGSRSVVITRALKLYFGLRDRIARNLKKD